MTTGYINILLHTSYVRNKTLESCNIWVNSRILSFCITDSSGHNADKLAANNQRAARIIMASVFTSSSHTSTDHVLSDSVVSGISTVTCCAGCDVYFDCMELWRKGTATCRESSPATDYSKGTSSGFFGRRIEQLPEMKHWNYWEVLLEGRVFYLAWLVQI